MPGGWTASTSFSEIKSKPFSPEVIMISGQGTIQTAVEATKSGAFEFLEKPLHRDRVLLTIRNALSPEQAPAREHRPAEEGREALRADRQPSADEEAVEGDPDRGADERDRSHLWRKRDGQGAHRPGNPRPEPAGQGELRPGQLRGDPRGAHRERALRPREGLVHGRDRAEDGQVRAGRRRDDLPRRDRRT